MRVHSSAPLAVIALLMGGLACAGNTARTAEDPDQAAAARDTTSDTTGVENPPGYRGMERDTAIAPQPQQEQGDTFLQNQGQGQPQDTSGYSGMERTDTSWADTTGAAAGARDTSGAWGADTSAANPTGVDTSSVDRTGIDTTGQSRTGDTTGYDPSQQPPQDTTSAP